jgi:choline dehydrogenase
MYDYIVVGAGAAGCVLAHRLTEDPACRVLLIEAGGEADSPVIRTPALFSQLQDSPYDWGDRTVPQDHLYGRRIFMPQGRVLGGSSTINFMIYIRGHRGDYDGWCQAGNPGWAYEDVLPYFVRSETNHGFSDRYHGASGPLSVISYPQTNPVVARYLAAAQAVGIPYNPDFNGERHEGCGPLQATISQGARSSAASAYLQPVRARPNLTVATHALATRVLFTGTRAVGVEYFRAGEVVKATAAREVLLAAGALRSPQLLMLSGIGPQAALARVGVKVLLDHPGVGQNLQDHLHTRVRFEINQPLTFAPLPPEQKAAAAREYEAGRTGPLATNHIEAGAFVKSAPEEEIPGLQLFCPMTLTPEYPEAGVATRHGLTFTSYINRPRSRGEITLSSADPLARPLINPNYFADPDDVRCAMAGVRWNLRILYAQPFDDLRGGELSPGADAHGDPEIEEFVRRASSTTWHPAGTCKMGNDPLAVVDPELRVHGCEGLRVVDAAIMPTIVSGNTNAPTIMIAEKAADLIRAAAKR